MRRVGRAASDSEDEQSAVAAPNIGERVRELVDGCGIDRSHDLADLTQVEGGI